jgi:hypothetical protein
LFTQSAKEREPVRLVISLPVAVPLWVADRASAAGKGGPEMILAIVLLLRAATFGSGVAIGFYKWREGPARNLWLAFGILCAILLVIGLAQPFVGNDLDAE